MEECYSLNKNDIKLLKSLIFKGEILSVIKSYYDILGNYLYSDANPEILYLKTQVNKPILGKELFYFKTPSSRNDIISHNSNMYIECIDKLILKRKCQNLELPEDIIKQKIPPLKDLHKTIKQEYFIHSIKQFTSDFEFYDKPESPYLTRDEKAKYRRIGQSAYTPKFVGIDIFQFTNIFNIPKQKIIPNLWTTLNRQEYLQLTNEMNIKPALLDMVKHKTWRGYKRIPDFTTVKSFDELSVLRYSISNMNYTGKEHIIKGREYYEVNLNINDNYEFNAAKSDKWYKGNLLRDLINTILYDAENNLRYELGLPLIGMGWISERNLFNLVKSLFPDSKFHHSPIWLKPQHLDIFIPSLRMGIEYQGEQHFKPIDYFGGKKGFIKTVERDLRKKEVCNKNKIKLIYIRFDEDITLANVKNRIGIKND